MDIVFGIAGEDEAAPIAALRMAASRDLTARFGAGPWSFAAESKSGVLVELRTSTLVFARCEGTVVGALRLATKNPWMGAIDFFTPCERPIYLTSMAVTPKRQRQGVGRALLGEARRVARDLRGQAIRLDSYDGPAGAGEFYPKCGFQERRRAEYNGTPLIWFESTL